VLPPPSKVESPNANRTLKPQASRPAATLMWLQHMNQLNYWHLTQVGESHFFFINKKDMCPVRKYLIRYAAVIFEWSDLNTFRIFSWFDQCSPPMLFSHGFPPPSATLHTTLAPPCIELKLFHMQIDEHRLMEPLPTFYLPNLISSLEWYIFAKIILYLMSSSSLTLIVRAENTFAPATKRNKNI
jgi:hypothetical protein